MSMRPSPTTPGWYESFYRSSRTRTLVVIIGGILALSGVGLLAGVLVDAEALPLHSEQIVPGRIDERPPAATAPLPQAETPSPLASPVASPSPVSSPVASPVASPTALPSPTPSPSPLPTEGEELIIDGGTVTIPVPPPWTGEVGPNGDRATAFSGQGDWFFALVALDDPTVTTAEGIILANTANFLPSENYTGLVTNTPQAQEPFGNLVSLAAMAYRATWVDPQSSFPVEGNMWVALRQDGKVLLITAESTPWERFASVSAWRPLVDGAFNSFAFPGL